MNKYFRIIGFCALAFFAITLTKASSQSFIFKNPLEGKKAPSFSLSTLDERSVDFSKYRENKKTVLFFWTTWCPHCRTALRDLNSRQDEIKQRNIALVTVNVGENRSNVESYRRKNNITMDIFLDEDSSVSEKYGVSGIPSFYYINEDGIIKATNHNLPENFETLF